MFLYMSPMIANFCFNCAELYTLGKMDMIINLNSVQANDVFIIHISSK